MKNLSAKTRFLVLTGVMSALAIILYFIEFPVIPGLNYLMIDVSDLPAAVGGVILGPVAAICIELIKVIVHVIIKGFGSTMGFGDLINFLVGSALTAMFSAVFRKLQKKNLNLYLSVLIAGLAGLVSMVAVGIVGNYLIAPPYFKVMLHVDLGGAALWGAIWGATALNIAKSIVISILMVPVITILKRGILKANMQN